MPAEIPTTDPQITINHTAGTNEIEIRVTYPMPGHAGQQHRGWLRAWKSGRLAQLIDTCTWE